MRHRPLVGLVGGRKWSIHIHLTAGGSPQEGKIESQKWAPGQAAQEAAPARPRAAPWWVDNRLRDRPHNLGFSVNDV